MRRLVYVDTGPLPDGFSQNDFSSPEEQQANADSVAEHGDGWRLPPSRRRPVELHRDDRWTYVELPTWHWPMSSRPSELADALAATCGS